MLCGGAYHAARYYVYRLIAGSGATVRLSDVRLSLFPLGIAVHNINDFPIRHDNLISFAGINAYLPPTSLFMKKKEISVEIDRPRFAFNDNLLKGGFAGKRLGSSFTVNRIHIHDGELEFKGRDIACRLLHFNLQTGVGGDDLALRLDSPHLKVTLPVSGEPVSLEGDLSAEARRHPAFWKIGRFTWRTSEITFNGNGRILDDGSFQLNASAQGDPQNILRPLLEELTIRGLTYADASVAKDEQGVVRVTADFTSPSCSIKESRYSNLAGHLDWDDESRELKLAAAAGTGMGRAAVRLDSRDRQTTIDLRNIPAAHVAEFLDISEDAPLAGLVTKGSIEISPDSLRGQADLDAAPNQPLDRSFVARGRIDFQRDKRTKQTIFSGERLQFSGGGISINGKTDSLAHTTDIRIACELKNLENMAPYSVYYLDIDLLPWKLSGGNGAFSLSLKKGPGRKQIDSNLRLSDFQANRQSISLLRGDIRQTALATSGDFTVSAPDLSAGAELAIADRRTTIHFHNVAGESRKIMKILGLDADLHGRIAGDFTYRSGQAPIEPEVTGNFAAPRLSFMGYDLARLKSALRSNLTGIDLQDLEFTYKEGRGRAGIFIDFGKKRFDLRGRIDDMNVAQLLGGFSGRADVEVDGRGEFLKEPLKIAYRLRNTRFYSDRTFGVSGTARLLTDFSDFDLEARGEASHNGGPSPFSGEIKCRGARSEGSFKFDLKDLNQLIPWKNNAGAMRLLGQIYTGADGAVHSRGVAVFSGRTLSLPSFSHTLDNFQGTITFVGNSFLLQSLSGEIGGGRVEGDGRLVLGKDRLRLMTFNLKGRGLHLYPMDRTSCLVDPDLTLRYDQGKLLLSGTLDFPSVEWQREIDERIVFSTRSELTTVESKIHEMLRLDIAMNCENVQMRNSLGRIEGRFKLRLGGTAAFPILIGTCEGRRGEIYLSDRPFNLLKAKMVFNNNAFIDPLIQVESEAFIQNYRIRFDIRGNASHAKPELAASPPLPVQDILALVSLGEAFERTGSLEISSQQGGTAMVTGKLTEEIKNRANKLLGINLLRIDPVLSEQSSLNTSRLTIGKTIAKDLVVVYSTNLSTSRRELLYLQYQLSPAISLIAMRDEDGYYSLDLRLRSRR